MNCANHTDQSAVAYCRTCGKALCANCTRNVRGVIYCENCLAARLEGVQPPAQPAGSGYVPPNPPSSGPNPALAGILGAIPFGVGAVYNGQYAKGLAHLIIFSLLCIGANRSNDDTWGTVFGLGIAFFVIYQIIDAVRSARAIQAGKPAPDPFGLAQTFGGGEKFDSSKVPTGAVVLIGLGVLFLLRNVGLFSFDFDRIWPVFLIALGGWLFAQRWGLVGASPSRCYCDRCRMRGLMGPAVLVTIGVLSLLESVSRFGWHRTWPILILVIGIVKLMQSNASGANHISVRTIDAAPPPSSDAGQAQPPVDEVKNV